MDDIRDRISGLENSIEKLRYDGAVTRSMAALADRGAAEHRQNVRTDTCLLNALRETQVEQVLTLQDRSRTLSCLVEGQRLHQQRADRIEAHLDDRIENFSTRVDGIDTKIDGLTQGITLLTEHLLSPTG